MSRRYYLGGAELVGRVLEFTGPQGELDQLVEAANYCELGSGGATIDDPNADLEMDLRGWQEFWIDEDDATPQRLYTGFLWASDITVVDAGTGARRWDCDIADLNTILKWPIFTGADCKRPAETDLQRMAWLMGSPYLQADVVGPYGAVQDTGYLNLADNPVAFGEADYRGRTPLDLISDIVGVAGKQCFLFWDDGAISIYYDLPAVDNFASTLMISDVAADIDLDDVFPPLDGYRLHRTAEDQYGDLSYVYKGVRIVRSRPATITLMGKRRGTEYSTDRVGQAATAEAQAAALLELMAVEKDTLFLPTELPRTHVNRLRAGQVFPFRSSVLPGYDVEEGVPLRATRRILRLVGHEHYEVHYEASIAPPTPEPGPGVPGGGVVVHRPCSGDPTFIQSATGTSVQAIAGTTVLGAAPTPGNMLVAVMWSRPFDHTHEPTGFTAVTDYVSIPTEDDGTPSATEIHRVRMYYRVVEPGDSATISWTGAGTNGIATAVAEFSGVGSLSAFDTALDDTDQLGGSVTIQMGTVTPTAGAPVLLVGAGGLGSGDNDPSSGYGADGGATSIVGAGAGPFQSMIYRVVDNPSGSYSLSSHVTQNSRGTGGVAAAFVCTGSDQPPGTGQWVENELVAIGDGTTVTFTTDFPFAPGSLRVRYDNVDQTAAIVSYDETTGEFTMAGAPLTGWQVTVDYQGI